MRKHFNVKTIIGIILCLTGAKAVYSSLRKINEEKEEKKEPQKERKYVTIDISKYQKE